MKILIVGAGAIGGYFGGRLLEKGVDVTFLVREKRKMQLEKTGLNIDSVHGNAQLVPRLLTTNDKTETFDVILISTKSYHLTQVIEDIRPSVKNDTTILPLLNGIAHIDLFIEHFGEETVIGGLCFIETTLDKRGTIIQKSPIHQLIYGERSGKITPRIEKLQEVFEGANAAFEVSPQIIQEMWHKYLFIATLSGITSLMGSAIGPIMTLESGRHTIASVLTEIESIMQKIGAPIQENITEEVFAKISRMPFGMKSSMQRDMEKSLPLEADHLHGFLLQHASTHQIPVPILETIYTKLKIYENER
ncbi:ketopantoate reductase family protein [Sporosarcina sp. ACRSM]|uniref:ketopantoate reductase family protein n=1 Tax=Sporosarcina sp. ACRSM TaxID=2918216 RepID=UPI001EF55DB8|nr:ketopantoate reductase family protein [Sporosarcina sp. ACRSM]MCG7335607.1 ketopantoate reductase family protein [Sporosarcina sp. ACRSM]